MIADGNVGVVAGFKGAAYACLESPLKFIVSTISRKKMPSPTMDATRFARDVRVDEVCFITDFFLPWRAAFINKRTYRYVQRGSDRVRSKISGNSIAYSCAFRHKNRQKTDHFSKFVDMVET